MTHFRSKIIWITSLAAVLAGLGAKAYIDRQYEPLPVDFPTGQYISPVPATGSAPGGNPTATSTPTNHQLPANILLQVPFTSQSPDGNWTGIFKEGCEEASVLMAAEYYNGNREANLPVDFAMREIRRIADWENERFGYNLDINNQETEEMARELYGLETEIVESFSEDTLKKALADGKLVLLPADGRLLNNPNFRRPGPPYHMLVIKGYNSQGFITNDPGTRNGRNYAYTFQTLHNAAGEWDHTKDAVDTSAKEVIIVWK